MTNELILCKAMLKAKEVFDKYLEKQGYDGIYFALYLTGYINDSNFRKWKEIRMDTNGIGHEVFQYPDKEIKDDQERL